jgi:CRP/FNR family transcriptional regulator
VVSTKAQVLKRAYIFSRLSDEALDELTKLSIERNFASGEFIFWEGEPADWFYILIEGQVKVLKHSSQGKEFIIAFFGPGEMFGEVAVFENKPYPASAQANTETRVLGIRRDDFLSFLASHPAVAIMIISILSGRLREAQNRLRDLASERVEQRLASTLLMLSAKLGTSLPFTRQELADMTGTTTETAIRVMSRFKESGIIRSVRGKVIIIDREKLRLLSEGPPGV